MDIELTNPPFLDPEIFTVTEGEHNGRAVLWISFSYSKDAVQEIKQKLPEAKWSQSNKKWYLQNSNSNRIKLGLSERTVGKEVLSKIPEHNLQPFNDFVNCLKLKAYSQNTIRTYSIEFAQLLIAIKNHNVQDLTEEKLKSYFLYCINELKLSENYLHSRINAIKFYFEKVLHRPKMFVDIPRPKKPILLPKALNASEIKKIINNTENLKHRLIIKLCYGMGLRVSEIVKLRVQDIDSKQMKVLVSCSKGKKDRYVNLPESILLELREYYRIYRPENFLFEGKNGEQYAVRSAQAVFKKAMKKSGIRKTVGIHSLRHSYATHLLEAGTDISLIQKLLGHNNISTTLVYAQVTDKNISKVKSPLDGIE
ncbi:site-specific integrase [Chryseobacterium suipulveris]|uniref:Site-specific integrase n=1 Tax=Chryseobacterium suipulveris TaxID=2929800 RepID=A0ABY4BST4_9FLAO|nr:tyrosine-type recombinase/integrase [Chryseobacterium suipulveris]UOE42252.1 site-specific integrase [Chryseobacterium suipulveris]